MSHRFSKGLLAVSHPSPPHEQSSWCYSLFSRIIGFYRPYYYPISLNGNDLNGGTFGDKSPLCYYINSLTGNLHNPSRPQGRLGLTHLPH